MKHAPQERDFRELHEIKKKAEPFFYSNGQSDTVAILVHGFTGSPNDMRELSEYLHAGGIDVKGVRMAGHGSHYSDLMRTTHGDWWHSVNKAVEEVLETHRRIFLIGYSFGANIVLDLAARNPERFSGIICLGTSIFPRHEYGENILYYFFKLFRLQKWRKPYVSKGRVESFEAGGNYADIPTKSAGQLYSFIRKYTKKELSHITTPALIIHSRDDRISHPRSSEFLFDQIASKQKEMFILNEPNHNPLRSDNKNSIFDRVVSFIEG